MADKDDARSITAFTNLGHELIALVKKIRENEIVIEQLKNLLIECRAELAELQTQELVKHIDVATGAN